jgi:hypothetical protein
MYWGVKQAGQRQYRSASILNGSEKDPAFET